MPDVHRLYFSPGMFGFGRLASYDYFVHLERALRERLRDAGAVDVETYVSDVPPTASVRRRAARLAELVARTAEDDDGPIHLIGHSTGGLDARMVCSPDALLPAAPGALRWLPRLASVTTLSTPHYGTPLASFFATVSGQRMLYALSALTFIALSLGSPPLAAASALVVAVGRLDRTLGMQIRLIDSTTDALLRVLDDARSREVRAYLDAIKQDQGAVIQLTPEAMDIFQACVGDRPGVLYQCTASMAPPPDTRRFTSVLGRPWGTMSTTLFTTMQSLTARYDDRYPCAAAPSVVSPEVAQEFDGLLARAFGRAPGVRANDGVVPLRSQLWGRLVWAGHADHLDVLGHFGDDAPLPLAFRDETTRHVDWMVSGSGFDRRRFAEMTDAIAAGMMQGAAQRAAR